MHFIFSYGIALVGVLLVALGVYAAVPVFMRWRRPRTWEQRWLASPTSLFVDSGRFPIGSLTAPTVPPNVGAEEERLAALLSEVEHLRTEVEGLRSRLVGEDRQPRRSRCDLPPRIRRAFVQTVRRRRSLSWA